MHIFMYGDDWVRHLAKVVGQHPEGGMTADYCEYPQINPFILLRKVWRADTVMRVGVRPGGVGKRLFFLDCLWWVIAKFLKNKRVIYYWIGTDVLDASRQYKLGRNSIFSYAYRDNIHFSNAPWLRDELRQIGIESDLVLFPVGKVLPPALTGIEWPSRFAILAYVPDGRSAFYGGDVLMEAARRLPSIDFLVVGGCGSWLQQKPANVTFLGYVQDMGRVINQVHVVVRQVEHDAIGGTVREGLFYARHIIYSYPLPHTHCVSWGDVDALCNCLTALYAKFEQGFLSPNIKGREYATREWEPEKLLNAFFDAVRFRAGQ